MIGIVAALALLAQEPDRLSEATVAPVFADGRLRGCALTFKSVQRDNLYFGGRAVGADGYGPFDGWHRIEDAIRSLGGGTDDRRERRERRAGRVG